MGCCDHGNELSGSIIRWVNLQQLNYLWLLRDSDPLTKKFVSTKPPTWRTIPLHPSQMSHSVYSLVASIGCSHLQLPEPGSSPSRSEGPSQQGDTIWRDPKKEVWNNGDKNTASINERKSTGKRLSHIWSIDQGQIIWVISFYGWKTFNKIRTSHFREKENFVINAPLGVMLHSWRYHLRSFIFGVGIHKLMKLNKYRYSRFRKKFGCSL